MKSLFDTKISYYRNVEDNVGTEISLRDFLFNDQSISVPYRMKINKSA